MDKLIKIPQTGTDQFIDGDNYPCIVCGKTVKKPIFFLRVVEGGSHALFPGEEYIDTAADLGMYPVGTHCLKKFPELKPYAQTL